jgi:hypothetical protein
MKIGFKIFLIFSVLILIFTAEVSCQKRKFVFGIDYLIDRPIFFKPYPFAFSEHQFLISLAFKNKFRGRIFLGVPHAVMKQRRNFYGNNTIGIGAEYIFNKRNRKLFLSAGLEYAISKRTIIDIYSRVNYLNIIGRISYRIDRNLLVIFEPFEAGIGRFYEFHANLPTNREPYWYSYFGRFLAIGVSIQF